MAKIINSCYECAHHYGYYCSHPSRDKSVYATKVQLPHVGIPVDCPLEDAPEIDRLSEIHAPLRLGEQPALMEADNAKEVPYET